MGNTNLYQKEIMHNPVQGLSQEEIDEMNQRDYENPFDDIEEDGDIEEEPQDYLEVGMTDMETGIL